MLGIYEDRREEPRAKAEVEPGYVCPRPTGTSASGVTARHLGTVQTTGLIGDAEQVRPDRRTLNAFRSTATGAGS